MSVALTCMIAEVKATGLPNDLRIIYSIQVLFLFLLSAFSRLVTTCV
jgi:hypothetical protein